jgi:hypothetical protein
MLVLEQQEEIVEDNLYDEKNIIFLVDMLCNDCYI